MAEIPAYGTRFDFGRLFTDCGRVAAGAGLPLAIGVVLLGVAPVTAASLPWWSAPSTSPDVFRRVWVVVTTAKGAVDLVALSVLSLFVTAASLKVLTRTTWAETLQPRRLIVAFGSAFGVTLIGNGPSLAAPIVIWLSGSAHARGILGWAELVDYFLVMASIGIAVPVAVDERVAAPSAIARAFRLLAGLRWRIASVGVAYLVLSGACTYAVELALWLARVDYRGPGVGLAAVRLPVVVVGAIFHVALVSFFLQARRIADGPSAVELHEVFA